MAHTSTTGQLVGRLPLIRTRPKARPKKKLKTFNVVLNEDGVAKVEKIKSRIYPSTQTEVFRSAVQLLEAILDETDDGSEFFIKRAGGDLEPYQIIE